MDFFDEAALRLKQQLKVTEDKQVAEALGLSGNAWTMRKRRGSFPEKELRALAQRRPDLGVDVEYVLTGAALSAHQRQAQYALRRFTLDAGGLSEGERAHLLDSLNQANLELATANARRDADYQQIIEVLRGCSDETVALALHLVVKLFRAEQAEKSSARRVQKPE